MELIWETASPGWLYYFIKHKRHEINNTDLPKLA